MNDMICKAIWEARLLSFTYKGASRWVEPHAYGRQANGNDSLSAWQLGGGSGEGFRLFLLSELQNLTLGDPFDGPRPDYRKRDKRFVHIYAEL